MKHDLIRKARRCRKVHWLFLLSVGPMVVVGIAVAVWKKPEAVGPGKPFLSSDVPRLVYRGREFKEVASVLFEFPLTPTADPLVWEYRPSSPPIVPANYRVTFKNPVGGKIQSVRGRIVGLEFDLERRMNNVPGCVVMVDCEPET